MIISYRAHSSTSNIERVFLYKDSGATAGTEGDPITGLTHDSTGLSISSIANNEATAVTETVAGTDDIEDITTLGTYAAPTAGKCRFKEVDATAHPGLFEIQLADARYAVAGAKYLDICISGVADLAPCHVRVYLDVLDASGIRAALGLASNDLDTQLGALQTKTEAEARSLPSADYATDAGIVSLAEILSEALDGTGPFTADMTLINGNATSAQQLARSAETIEFGTASGTPSTTVIPSNLTGLGSLVGRIVIVTSGDQRAEATSITGYDSGTGELTVTGMAGALASGDTFVVL